MTTPSEHTPDPSVLRSVVERFPFGAIVVFDEDLRYTHATGGGLEPVGLSPEDLVGRTIHEVWPEGTLAAIEEPFRNAVAGEETTVEVPWAGRQYVVWAGPLEGPEPRGVAVTVDVSARAELQSTLDLIESAVGALHAGVSIADAHQPDIPLIYVNRGFTEITGYEAAEVLGRNCRFLQGEDTDPDHVKVVRDAIQAGEDVQVTLLNYRKDGEPFWNRLTISPVRTVGGSVTHYVGIQEDVTQHRELGRQLEVRERLSAVGQLAGGVAHDVRNVLTGVGGLIELVLERELPDEARQDLEEAVAILDRAGSVAERLLVFSRDQSSKPAPLELTDYLRRRLSFFRKVFRETVDLSVDGSPDDLWVLIDEGQLDQALLNLLKNAEEAMTGPGTAVLEVAGGADAMAPVQGPAPGEGENDWIRITVRDSGAGMPAAVREKALEPFYTTKSEGGGTGLGLATVYGTVRSAGGQIHIESEPGTGTAVHMLLPETEERPEDGDGHLDAATDSARVLLVEDEAAVRKVTSRALEAVGHQVVEAADGEEGWNSFLSSDQAFDLIITDAVMPGLSGVRLIEKVRARAPDLPVILMTGYTEEELEPGERSERTYLLEKPFKLPEIRALVTRALNDGGD